MQPKSKISVVSFMTVEHNEEFVRSTAASIEFAELQLKNGDLDITSFHQFVKNVTNINQLDDMLVIQSRKDSIRKALRKMRLEIRTKYN